MDISDTSRLDASDDYITDARLVSWRDNQFDPARDMVPVSLMQPVEQDYVMRAGPATIKPVAHKDYDKDKPSGWGLVLRENQTTNIALQDDILSALRNDRDTGSLTLE